MLRALVVLAGTVMWSAAWGGTEWEATYNASAGYTDNATVATDTMTGETTALPSAFMTLSPGLAFASESPRLTQKAGYVFTANLFADSTGANSTSHQVNYSAGTSLSPMTDLLFTTGAGVMQTNTASLDSGVGGMGGAVSGGESRFLTINGALGLSHDLSPLWRMVESLSTTVFTPVGSDSTGSSSFSGNVSLGAEREFLWNRLFVGAVGGTSWIERPATGGGDATQYSVGVTSRWTHTLARRWTSELGAGALYATLSADPSQFAILPTASAALSWRDEDGNSMELTYNRGATLNPLVAEVFASDNVALRGGMPLFRTRMALATSVSYQYAETLLPAPGTDPQHVNTFTADVGLGYEITATLSVGVRYQFVRQRSDSLLFPDVDRQTFVVTVAGRYPDTEKRKLNEKFSKPTRMDRNSSDEDEKPRRDR